MTKVLNLVPLVLSILSVFSRPLRPLQLLPAIQISWVESSPTPTPGTTANLDSASSSRTSEPSDTAPTPFLWVPSLPPPAPVDPLSVSISTTIEIISETFTTTVYEAPETVKVTVPPATVTNTITVSEPFTATPGSFWSSPDRFSNLDSFKIAHFATGERNLQITNGVPADASNSSLAINFMGLDSDMEASYGPYDTWNSSSALQLFYPEGSINPGNSPQGGADFYATPLPLADASNVTLEYSVFFPEGFDWVRGGKLPGLYGGHMTCSGGDDATSCFSTRLMWREDGAGELYLYAPKDKQTYNLCHAPPESVCNSAYGLSIGRGSFKFTPGAWTTVQQTVGLNTPGQHDGGFRLEVNGELIMNRHDVFYRDVPSTTSSSTQTGSDGDADNGGLLSPLLGGVLKPANGSGIYQGILPPLINETSPSSSISAQYPIGDRPPLLSTQQSSSQLPTTNDAASTPIYDSSTSRSSGPESIIERPTVTRIIPQSTVTVANYFWEHAFTGGGSEKSILGIGDKGDDMKPISFSGLFFSTFFGGSSEEYATPKDQYTWFRDFSITINS